MEHRVSEHYTLTGFRRPAGEGGRAQRGVGALPADCSFAAGLLVPFLLSSERSSLSFFASSTIHSQCFVNFRYNLFLSYQVISLDGKLIDLGACGRYFSGPAASNFPTGAIIKRPKVINSPVELTDGVNVFRDFPDFYNKAAVSVRRSPDKTDRYNNVSRAV